MSDIALWALPGQQPSIFGHLSLLITSLTERAEGWWLAGAEWAGSTSENNHIIDNTMVKEQFRYISILEVSGGRDEGGGRWPCWPSWPAAHWPSWHTCWRRWCPRWGWRTGALFDTGLDKVRGSLLCSPWGTWSFWGFSFVLFHVKVFLYLFFYLLNFWLPSLFISLYTWSMQWQHLGQLQRNRKYWCWRTLSSDSAVIASVL